MAQITLNSSGVASNGALVLQSNGTTTAVTINASQGVEVIAGTAALPALTTTGDTNTGIFFPAADTIAFSEGGVEAMRIDSSGNLLVGTTSYTQTPSQGFVFQNTSNSNLSIGHANGTGSGNGYMIFAYNGDLIGSITQSGTTAVSYNTTSDYRLKTVIGPVANAGQRIDALQPVEYTWNADGSRTRGFLAHQFAEVYAGSVSGTKDAVDAQGKPVYQAMQASTSEVIADLVAEIKSLRARVAQLESN